MKRALMVLAMVGAVGCLAGATANAASRSDANASAKMHRSQMHRPQMTDVSAARRHNRYWHSARGAYGAGYGRGYYGSGYARGSYGSGQGYGWRAGDPTAGPNSLLSFYRHNNICAIDEGYGRATRCD